MLCYDRGWVKWKNTFKHNIDSEHGKKVFCWVYMALPSLIPPQIFWSWRGIKLAVLKVSCGILAGPVIHEKWEKTLQTSIAEFILKSKKCILYFLPQNYIDYPIIPCPFLHWMMRFASSIKFWRLSKCLQTALHTVYHQVCAFASFGACFKQEKLKNTNGSKSEHGY